MIQVVFIVLALLNIINIIFHSASFLLLSYINKNKGDESCQQVYIVHLCVCEILINILILTLVILNITLPTDSPCMLGGVCDYISVIYFSAPFTVYFLLMCFITIDKLLEVVLHIRYPTYVNRSKAKVAAAVAWVTGGVMGVQACIYHAVVMGNKEGYVEGLLSHKMDHESHDMIRSYFTFFYPLCHIMFTILSITTYTLIFHRFKQSRYRPNTQMMSNSHTVAQRKSSGKHKKAQKSSPTTTNIAPSSSRCSDTFKISSNKSNTFTNSTNSRSLNNNYRQSREKSTFQVFLRSRFYVCILLVASYVMFVAVPDTVYLFYGILHHKEKEEVLHTACFVCSTVATTVDVYAYVFVQPSVKRTMWKLLRMWKGRSNVAPSTGSRTALAILTTNT